MRDKQAECRAIIEAALFQLQGLGMTRESAAALLAVQAIVRLDDPASLAPIALLARETAEGLTNREGLH